MRTRPFQQVDVFSSRPGLGNALAVVLDADDLSDEAMQRFARWTQLSETTFVLPPTPAAAAQGADYRVRIFTPGGELPFAGHPTLGSAHAWLRAGGKARDAGCVVQECGIGLVRVRQSDGHLAFAAPPLRRTTPSPALLAEVTQALGLAATQVEAAQQLDNGPVWLGLLLCDADTVLSLRPDSAALKALGVKVGVAGVPTCEETPALIGRSNREARAFGQSRKRSAAPAVTPVDLEVRAFAAAMGVEEDPVTGSLNASLAQWLIADAAMPARYVAGQGQCLGRDGRVLLEQDAQGQIWVGGAVQDCIAGHVMV